MALAVFRASTSVGAFFVFGAACPGPGCFPFLLFLLLHTIGLISPCPFLVIEAEKIPGVPVRTETRDLVGVNAKRESPG